MWPRPAIRSPEMSSKITLGVLKTAATGNFPLNFSQEYRYSTPFFYTPHIDHPIVCLPTCCDDANPPKYPPITYGEYRVWWLNNNYQANLKNPI